MDDAASRAICYRFLAQLLLSDPDPELLTRLGKLSTFAMPGGSEGTGGPGAKLVFEGLQQMTEALSQIAGGDVQTVCSDLSRQRTRLFRGLAPGYGPPPPYEALHRAGRGQSEIETVLAIQGIFAEAGVEPATGMKDRPDFLGLELDLMALLCEEEAEYLTPGDRNGASRAAFLQGKLLRDHLLKWVPSYCRALREEAGNGFYGGFSKMLEGFLADEAALLAG